jgi:hypothetical protein
MCGRQSSHVASAMSHLMATTWEIEQRGRMEKWLPPCTLLQPRQTFLGEALPKALAIDQPCPIPPVTSRLPSEGLVQFHPIKNRTAAAKSSLVLSRNEHALTALPFAKAPNPKHPSDYGRGEGECLPPAHQVCECLPPAHQVWASDRQTKFAPTPPDSIMKRRAGSDTLLHGAIGWIWAASHSCVSACDIRRYCSGCFDSRSALQHDICCESNICVNCNKGCNK